MMLDDVMKAIKDCQTALKVDPKHVIVSLYHSTDSIGALSAGPDTMGILRRLRTKGLGRGGEGTSD